MKKRVSLLLVLVLMFSTMSVAFAENLRLEKGKNGFGLGFSHYKDMDDNGKDVWHLRADAYPSRVLILRGINHEASDYCKTYESYYNNMIKYYSSSIKNGAQSERIWRIQRTLILDLVKKGDIETLVNEDQFLDALLLKVNGSLTSDDYNFTYIDAYNPSIRLGVQIANDGGYALWKFEDLVRANVDDNFQFGQ